MRHASFLLLAAALLALPACGAPPPGTALPAVYAYDETVEVSNDLDQEIVIRYHRNRGGPYTLGVVSAHSKATFPLPGRDVESIYAETSNGNRVTQNHRETLVRIRRSDRP